MSSLTRRHLLHAGGAAAAGAVVLSPLGASAASAATRDDSDLVPTGDETLVVYVRNSSAGEVSVLVDEDEITFNDPQLVARVQRAARNAR